MISKKPREPVEKLSRAERVRLTFEELGPTYIKLGQTLSTRPDLIPMEFIQELSKLQDRVPPVPFREAKAIIEKELDRPLEELFDSFDETPIASASIGQVHKAGSRRKISLRSRCNGPVSAKIIEVDLEIMLHLATLIERHIEEAGSSPARQNRGGICPHDRKRRSTIPSKLPTWNGLPAVSRTIPNSMFRKFYHERSTPRVLTIEFVDGIKVSDIERLEALMDMQVITERGADPALKQIFGYGFFHADPHPGNIFVLPDNVICLLDFGMMGAVDSHHAGDFVGPGRQLVLRR